MNYVNIIDGTDSLESWSNKILRENIISKEIFILENLNIKKVVKKVLKDYIVKNKRLEEFYYE